MKIRRFEIEWLHALSTVRRLQGRARQFLLVSGQMRDPVERARLYHIQDARYVHFREQILITDMFLARSIDSIDIFFSALNAAKKTSFQIYKAVFEFRHHKRARHHKLINRENS